MYGTHPILCALSADKRNNFYALYVQDGNLNIQNHEINNKYDSNHIKSIKKRKSFKTSKLKYEIQRICLERKIPIISTSRYNLNMMSKNRPHNGIILDVDPLNVPFKTKLSINKNKRNEIWLILDEIFDPQNFGAILRSGYFFGLTGVVVCKKNNAPFSSVTAKASSGALDLMNVIYCLNMQQFLTNCKKERNINTGEKWRIVGLDVHHSKSISVNKLQSGLPTLIVIGSEGRGIRKVISQKCDYMVTIPQNQQCISNNNNLSPSNLVDSLNVSNAAAIVLFHLTNLKP